MTAFVFLLAAPVFAQTIIPPTRSVPAGDVAAWSSSILTLPALQPLQVFSFDGSPLAAVLPSPTAPPVPPAGPAEPVMSLAEFAGKLSGNKDAMNSFVTALRSRLSVGVGWPGLGMLDSAIREKLIAALQGADQAFLDSFPTMTIPELQAFISTYGKVQGPVPDPAPAPGTVERLELTGVPREAADGAFLRQVAPGVYYGDKTLHGLATPHGDNATFSRVLNNLALNEPGAAPAYQLALGGRRHSSVRGLLEDLVANGHTVVARDIRKFANFGDLWLAENGGPPRSVATPLYVRTGVILPSGREFTAPVSHTHIEVSVRGPWVNADMIYYLGVDGASGFNPNATADQPWVKGREVKRWTGAEALDLIDRAVITRRELRLKVLKHGLPLGGYGPLGGCSDIHALILNEPIYPQIRNARYYQDGMTVDSWAAGLPLDGYNTPDAKRVYDSLPVTDPDEIQGLPQTQGMVRELRDMLRSQGRL